MPAPVHPLRGETNPSSDPTPAVHILQCSLVNSGVTGRKLTKFLSPFTWRNSECQAKSAIGTSTYLRKRISDRSSAPAYRIALFPMTLRDFQGHSYLLQTFSNAILTQLWIDRRPSELVRFNWIGMGFRACEQYKMILWWS